MTSDSLSKVRADISTEMGGLDSLRRSARDRDPEALKAAARQFEAIMISMVMKSMREASGEDSLFGSEQGKMYGSMLDGQLAQTIAGRGIGVADMLVRQLSRAGQASGLTTERRAPAGGVASPATTGGAGPTAASGTASRPNVKADAIPAGVAAYSDQGGPAAFQARFASLAQSTGRSTGLPASFILGQAAVESGYGRREIRFADGSPSYNLFSIKAGKSWQGKTVDVQTTEYVDGVARKVVQKFRAYESYADSFADYANLLKGDSRYRNVLAQNNSPVGFAQALQQAGYATDPAYAVKVTRAIGVALSTGV